MTVLTTNSRTIIKNTFQKVMILLCVVFIFLKPGFSQNACGTPAVGDTLINCPAESVVMGIPTITGATFTWYKNGVRLAGPLPGDGNPTSFGFALRSASDNGHYTVERTQGSVI